jgi:hypothetical protein
MGTPYVIKDSKNLAVTANTAFYASAFAPGSGYAAQRTVLQISCSAAAVLTLTLDGVDVTLNGGVALVAGALYELEIVLFSAKTYNLKYAATATAQVYWYWGENL